MAKKARLFIQVTLLALVGANVVVGAVRWSYVEYLFNGKVVSAIKESYKQ